MKSLVEAAGDTIVRHQEARTHGRYLLRTPPGSGPWPLLLGFHGYAENAQVQLDALSQIPGADRWLVAAVQALHPFYTRDQRVVASWMTREDRELAIADNLTYVSRVLGAIREEFPTRAPLVCAGFSQGGAMAYRAAARCGADAVIALGADVPPDVADERISLRRVLIGRGTGDEWYTAEKHAADLVALNGIAVRLDSHIFDGGHEWTSSFRDAVGRLLDDMAGA
jgi:predicted esterase